MKNIASYFSEGFAVILAIILGMLLTAYVFDTGNAYGQNLVQESDATVTSIYPVGTALIREGNLTITMPHMKVTLSVNLEAVTVVINKKITISNPDYPDMPGTYHSAEIQKGNLFRATKMTVYVHNKETKDAWDDAIKRGMFDFYAPKIVIPKVVITRSHD